MRERYDSMVPIGGVEGGREVSRGVKRKHRPLPHIPSSLAVGSCCFYTALRQRLRVPSLAGARK